MCFDPNPLPQLACGHRICRNCVNATVTAPNGQPERPTASAKANPLGAPRLPHCPVCSHPVAPSALSAAAVELGGSAQGRSAAQRKAKATRHKARKGNRRRRKRGKKHDAANAKGQKHDARAHLPQKRRADRAMLAAAASAGTPATPVLGVTLSKVSAGAVARNAPPAQHAELRPHRSALWPGDTLSHSLVLRARTHTCDVAAPMCSGSKISCVARPGEGVACTSPRSC